MKRDEIDPTGLMREAYRIPDITSGECRSIFLDWALGLPSDADTAPLIQRLLERHAEAPEGHPMTDVLKEGLTAAETPRRRGGRAGRLT